MAKFNFLTKLGLTALLVVPAFGIANAADADKTFNQYWSITPVNADGTRGDDTTIQVQVWITDAKDYVCEVGGTDYFHGTEIPVTFKTFNSQTIINQVKNLTGTGNTAYNFSCFKVTTGAPVAQASATFGLTTKSEPEDYIIGAVGNQGFAWYTTSDQYVSGFIYNGVTQAPVEETPDGIVGTYTWTVKGMNTGTFASTGDAEEITVSVTKEGDSYTLQQDGEQTYFKDGKFTFTIDSQGNAVFPASINYNGQNNVTFGLIYGTAFDNVKIPYTIEGGFTMPSGSTEVGFLVHYMGSVLVGFYFEGSSENQLGGSSNPGLEEGVIGTYDWTITPVNEQYKKGQYTTIQVEVTYDGTTDNEDNYILYLSEKGNTNYFKGTSIPFTYYGDAYARFEGNIAIELDDQNLLFNVFDFTTGAPVVMGQFQFDFTPEAGFSTTAKNIGLGWYSSNDGKNVDAYDFGFLIGEYEADPEEPEAEYPELTTLAGDYKFTGTFAWETAYENLAELCSKNTPPYVFPDDADFTLNVAVNAASMNQIFGNTSNSVNLNYDPTTGHLTFANANLGSIMDFSDYKNYSFGIADANGTWTTPTSPSAYWQVEEDGTITVPDFTIVNFSVSPAVIVGRYTNCKIEPTVIEPAVEILSAVAEPADDETVTVNIKVSLTNIETNEVEGAYVTFVNNNDSTDQGQKVDATWDASNLFVTAVLTDVEEGQFSYSITVTLLGEDDDEIATSEPKTITFEYSGIDSIGTENGNVRYFNLNGVEIAKPENGIFIKVENGKATKIAK